MKRRIENVELFLMLVAAAALIVCSVLFVSALVTGLARLF